MMPAGHQHPLRIWESVERQTRTAECRQRSATRCLGSKGATRGPPDTQEGIEKP